jgi:hypothetical protein
MPDLGGVRRQLRHRMVAICSGAIRDARQKRFPNRISAAPPWPMRRRDSASAPRVRRDGWTIARQATFIRALLVTGSVNRAAAAAGMSRESAYRLRARPGHAAFAVAWDRAAAARKSHSLCAQGHVRRAARAIIPLREHHEGHVRGRILPHRQFAQLPEALRPIRFDSPPKGVRPPLHPRVEERFR